MNKRLAWRIAFGAILAPLIPITLLWLAFLAFVASNYARHGMDGVRWWIGHICYVDVPREFPLSCKQTIGDVQRCGTDLLLYLLLTGILVVGLIHTWRRAAWRRQPQAETAQPAELKLELYRRAFRISAALLTLASVFWLSFLGYLGFAYAQGGNEGVRDAITRVSAFNMPLEQISWCDRTAHLFLAYEHLFFVLLFTVILAVTATLMRPSAPRPPA